MILALFLLDIANAQDVPPPPRPETADLSLTPILESLKQTLIASGRVESTDPIRWQRITSVTVDPRACQMRVHRDSSFNGSDTVDRSESYFFETIDTVEALSQQQDHDLSRQRIGQARSVTYADPALYTVVLNGNGSSLLFRSAEPATEAAEAIRGAADICRVRPVSLNPAAGAPSLAETLHFVVDKLNDSGPVSYRLTFHLDGSSLNRPTPSFALGLATADPATCKLRFDEKPGFNGTPYGAYRRVVPFQRVEKLEVLPEQDALNRGRAPNQGVFSTEPMIYRLLVTYQGGDSLALRFREEEMANRVAKAMNHAVELCGGGSRDPF
jgi:hypothetical protein